MLADWLAPEVMRVVIPAALLIGYIGYHAWRWRVAHLKAKAAELPELAAENGPAKETDEEKVKVEGQGQEIIESSNRRVVESQPETQEPSDPETPVAGEEDFWRARAMPHQEIPDYRVDGLYLDLLGESADKGYAPAMAKLGEYAMRRETWVEAYFWMWRAQRSGMANLESVLRGIRQGWIMAGCPDEEENVHDLFDEERGSVGRALLNIASGRDAVAAREFLQANHPEFL